MERRESPTVDQKKVEAAVFRGETCRRNENLPRHVSL